MVCRANPSDRFFLPALFVLSAAYGAALVLFPLEPDSAQYASIAREMADGGAWLRVQHRGQDYLDKPPWLFWVAALFFKVFGATAFTWHLASVPALLLLGEGVRRFYVSWGLTSQTASWLLLVALSTPAFALMFSDVRCELWLTAFSAWAWWSGMQWLRIRRPRYVLMSGLFLGGALLSKSMVGLLLVAPVWLSGAYKLKTSRKSAVVLLSGSFTVSLILLLPMLWGLWQAFGSKGLRFFFWTQTFGRVTGENVWSNSPAPFFLWHTALWAWAPAVWGLVWATGKVLWQRHRTVLDIPALAVLILILSAFSLSRYQLSHYIYPLAPLATLNLGRPREAGIGGISTVMNLASLGLMLFVTGLCILLWQPMPWSGRAVLVGSGVAIVLVFLLCKQFFLNNGFVVFSAAMILFLNAAFYPALTPYRAGLLIARYAKEHAIRSLATYRWSSHELDFALRRCVPVFQEPVPFINWASHQLQHGSEAVWVALPAKDVATLKQRIDHNFLTEEISCFPYFRVALLTPQFLRPATRDQAVRQVALLKITYGSRP